MATAAIPLSGRITGDELTMIRDSIMYPFMLTMCERAKEDAQRSGRMFAPYFARLIELIMDDITRDLSAVRMEFRKRQIKVWDGNTIDGVLYYEYICRGYRDKFGVVREALRSEIAIRLGQYSARVLRTARERTC